MTGWLTSSIIGLFSILKNSNSFQTSSSLFWTGVRVSRPMFRRMNKPDSDNVDTNVARKKLKDSISV